MKLPLVAPDLQPGQERQHRTLISNALNECIKVRPPHDRTEREVTAGVTPIDYSYPPGHVLRYGAIADESADSNTQSINTAAIQQAIDAAGVAGEVIFPAIGTFVCNGSLTGLNFQTWRGESYELGAGGSQASLKCTKTNGTFITAGANPRFQSIRFLGVGTYTDATGAFADSTCIALKLTDSGITFHDCVMQNQFFCIETSTNGAFYIRWHGGEVVRCAVWLNMLQDCFDAEISRGSTFRFCNTVISSNASKYMHNLKVVGCSFEQWPGGLFNYIASASFKGTYFETDLEGAFGFNSNSAFTDSVSIGLFGCFLFLNNLNTFVNYGGLTGGTFTSIGNTICGSVDSGQNQYYFLPMDSGGSVSMVGDKLDDRGNGGGFFGLYVSDQSKVRNQFIVWPYEHANAGQIWTQAGASTRGASAPASGTWAVGDISWYTSAAPGTKAGWQCTTAGSPGTWSPFGHVALEGSTTYDPPNLADTGGATTTVTATGAALGDFAIASFSLDLQGISLTAYVSATDTVSVRFQNESGGALDLSSGTLRVRVFKPG